MSATGGRQRLHLPGEAGGHRWRTPTLCHVSSVPACKAAAHTPLLMRCLCVFPSRHKLADAKTRKVMGREEFRLLHYAGEVNYNVNGV